MSAPAPQVQYAGVGTVGADQYNTFVQVCQNYAQMRTFSALSNMVVYVLGASSPGDGGQGSYYWNASATAADNNSTIIAPSGSTTGRWVALSLSGVTIPVLSFAGGNSGLVYASLGSWVAIGNTVIFWFTVTLSAIGSSSGLATISGLPFPAGVSSFAGSSCTPYATGMTGLTGPVLATVGFESSLLDLYQWASNGVNVLQASNFTNSSAIAGVVVYRAD